MFDLISGGPRHPFHDRTAAPVVASIAGHMAVIALVVGLPLLYVTDQLPQMPTVMAFLAEVPPPPPPPPPPAPKAVARPAEAPRPSPAPAPGAFVAPVEAPPAIPTEPYGAMSSAGEGGVEGGIEGGVVGGVVGGFVVAPPPPPPPPAPPAPPAGPVRIGGNLQAPALLNRVEPAYPETALMAKVSGMVILEAVVDAHGSVESVKVLRSIKLLDNAAVEAVKQWKYSPLVLNGIPTPFVLTVTLSFRTSEAAR